MKDEYSAIDKLALDTLKESKLKITKPAAIQFARHFMRKVHQYNSERPEIWKILKNLGERKDRRKRR